jgi:hypothetical protein
MKNDSITRVPAGTIRKRRYLRAGILCALCALGALTVIQTAPFGRQLFSSAPMGGSVGLAPLTPWASIGGCGAGGSGGAGGGNIKWIGRGITGGLLDIQTLSNLEISQSRRNIAFTPRFTIRPTYTTQLAVTVPVLSKTGQFQPAAQLPATTYITGGIGDVMVDFSKSLGMSGEYSLMVSLTMPTGQYDIKRGVQESPDLLSNMLQLGTGVYAASLGLNYIRDFDKGMFLLDLLGTSPFALRFSGSNSQGWSYDTSLMTASDKRRFAYHFKPYGENDLGGYTPPSLFLAAYYGDKRDPEYVTSYGMTFSVPMGVTWIPSYVAKAYDPMPDPDFQAWSGTLQYGIEFSRGKNPFYLVVSKLIHDKASTPNQTYRYDPDYVNKWNGPDWRDFASTWSFTVGVKTSVF